MLSLQKPDSHTPDFPHPLFLGISTDPSSLFTEPSGTNREFRQEVTAGEFCAGSNGVAGLLLSYLKPHGFRAQRDSGVQTPEGLTWTLTQEL